MAGMRGAPLVLASGVVAMGAACRPSAATVPTAEVTAPANTDARAEREPPGGPLPPDDADRPLVAADCASPFALSEAMTGTPTRSSDARSVGYLAGPGGAAPPLSRGSVMTVPALPSKMAALRVGPLIVVAPRPKLRAAARWLCDNVPADVRSAGFEMIGDLGFFDASPADVAMIGRDAGVKLDVAEGGWHIECWNCPAPEVIASVMALEQVRTQ